MKNRLLPESTLIKVGPDVDPDRCTGRTTALALGYLATALGNHGMWVTVRDHHDHHGSHRGAYRIAHDVAQNLGLRFMEWRPQSLEFRSNIFGAP